MKPVEKIASLQNARIKAVCALQEKSRERRRQQLCVVEGAREIALALEARYTLEVLFCCPDLPAAAHFAAQHPDLPLLPVTEEVFRKIAYRESSDGLLALVHTRRHTLQELRLSANPFVIVLEAVEKPGNLGAILRTADAAAADAVVVCDPLTDLYNPNVIRSSVGCLFTKQVAVCSSAEALAWLHATGITVLAAELQAAQWYHECDMQRPCAVVMGTEADGLSSFWLQQADARIKIPMRGQIDSLNVSAATAILTFEAMRQRQFQAS